MNEKPLDALDYLARTFAFGLILPIVGLLAAAPFGLYSSTIFTLAK